MKKPKIKKISNTIQFPKPLYEKIRAAAEKGRRPITHEIILRLDKSFEQEK